MDNDDFVTCLRSAFDNSVEVMTTYHKINCLWQDKRLMSAYVVDFQILGQDLNWNIKGLNHHFKEGLADELWDEFTGEGIPGILLVSI